MPRAVHIKSVNGKKFFRECDSIRSKWWLDINFYRLHKYKIHRRWKILYKRNKVLQSRSVRK